MSGVVYPSFFHRILEVAYANMINVCKYNKIKQKKMSGSGNIKTCRERNKIKTELKNWRSKNSIQFEARYELPRTNGKIEI